MARASKPRSKELQQTTGAIPNPSDSEGVAAKIKGGTASQGSKRSQRQTNGAYMPITGPITNVNQLIRSKTVSKGSPGAFTTLAAYTTYLKGLSLADLHKHALEEMHITPIDDQERLIRRLETEWTDASRRLAGDTQPTPPPRVAFSDEQIAKQEALRRKMLGGR